jgi:SAM-dependent methyltransferase
MPNQSETLDKLNRRAYANPSLVRCYEDLNFIHKPEAVILEKLKPIIKDKPILDLGIGGGRTTRFLLEISKDYTGIDYTASLVESTKAKYPAAKILWGDARDLSMFSNGSFDLVMFSFNSIDYVGHQDRLQVLEEVRRVLSPGGFFTFSTHNRDFRNFDKFPWQQAESFNLLFLKSCLYALAFLPKHLIMKKHEVRTADYAIINDNAHGFSLLTYYISIKRQKTQLENASFENVEAYDMEGKLVESDRDFPWIYYLAQKARV